MKKIILVALLILTVPFSIFSATRPAGLSAESLTSRLDQKSAEQSVTILMTGDIMLGRYIATLRERNKGDFPFTYMPEILAKAGGAPDLVLANLEGPIAVKQIAYGDLIFRFDPEVAALLKKVGFTTFNLANNHTYNQGKAGYAETLESLAAAGLDSFGQPDSVNADRSSIIYEIKGVKIAFLGLDDVDYKINADDAAAKIQELDKTVDFLVIAIHWGIEYKKTASARQTELARKFIDAGADFIWGTHPHVVQNSEVYNGKTIYYSLGNFVFDQYWSAETQKGLVLAVKITKDKVEVKEIPVALINQGEPKPSN